MKAQSLLSISGMSVRKPRPRFGFNPTSFEVGSFVRYRKDLDSNPEMDVDYTLDDQIWPNGDILGQIVTGPDADDFGVVWEVIWTGVRDSDGELITYWWTYEELLELA
jgi:hypothetical protein